MLGADIFANADAPFEFENDFFKGRMLFLVKCNPPDPKWAPHFEGSNSNRAFEMQIQGKLKLLPKGEVILFEICYVVYLCSTIFLFLFVFSFFFFRCCPRELRFVSDKRGKYFDRI